jgi:predicted transposase/invertase (TIGR01784 family)
MLVSDGDVRRKARVVAQNPSARDMSKPLVNIHDAFFKQALSDPQLAGAFLHEHLPAEVACLLGEEPPEPVPVSFVDEELRQHHSDLLFRVPLNTGANALVYVLVEHKSSRDQAARLQLLRYIVRVLVNWYEQNKKQLPLPVVLPLLVHQGPGKWKISCEFADLFGSVPGPLRPYLPSFRHTLVDLAKIDDRALSGQARLRAFLKALKYSRRRDLLQRIDILLAEAPLLEETDLVLILTYLDKGPRAVSNTLLRETLQRLVPERTERIMGWLTQPYFEKGKAEGRTEGRAEGEANMLVRLIEKRFGVVSPRLRRRIFAADVATLEEWFERTLDAADLRAVFTSRRGRAKS